MKRVIHKLFYYIRASPLLFSYISFFDSVKYYLIFFYYECVVPAHFKCDTIYKLKNLNDYLHEIEWTSSKRICLTLNQPEGVKIGSFKIRWPKIRLFKSHIQIFSFIFHKICLFDPFGSFSVKANNYIISTLIIFITKIEK